MLHEILKQKGIEKIKELYMKKLSLSLHKIGVIEENKPEGYVVVGGFVHINQVKLQTINSSIIIRVTVMLVTSLCWWLYDGD